jgi:GNAT superfamily N-acetyltransferase
VVSPTCRGKGIGHALIAEAYRRDGGERINLLSDESAITFYSAMPHRRKAGFLVCPPFSTHTPPDDPSETPDSAN